MSFKRIICLICLGAFEFGCSNQNYVKLPECKQVISLDSTLNLSVSSFLKNNHFEGKKKHPFYFKLENLNRLLLVVTLLYKNSYYESKDYFLRTNYFIL